MNNDALVHALGWALAHSLWQATAAALIVMLLLPRIRTARHRYRFSFCALLGVFFAMLATTCWYYTPENYSSGASTSIQLAAGFFDKAPVPLPEPQTAWQLFSAWLDEHNNLLVGIWLTGFSFFLLRLGGSLWHLRRLRRKGVFAPGADLLERFNQLRMRLGFRKPVSLLESSEIKTPMALGWLKPLVLLPVGIVNQLSVAEVDAVLAHELAHIARRDWIFNLLQALVESLFYYHPAVWWISAVVRRERENCCDDAALAATGNPLAFAKALVLVQEQAIPVPALALGLQSHHRKPLLDRVRRILNQPPQQQDQAMEKITATVILLALLALVSLRANTAPAIQAAFSRVAELPAQVFGTGKTSREIPTDTVPKPKTIRKITREDDNQKVEAEYQDDKLIRLNINGKEIPESEYNQHDDMLKTLRDAAEAPDAPESPDFPLPATPPMPPAPPMPADAWGRGFIPGQPIRIRSDKDGQGNTMILLEKEGKPTEIVIKDGKVFVDGQKLDKDTVISIPGAPLPPSPGDATGFNYNFRDNDFRILNDAPGAPEEEGYDAEARTREHERAFREQQRAYEIDRRRAEAEMKRGQKEMKKNQKEWEREQKEWKKHEKEWREQQTIREIRQEARQAEQQAARAKSDALEQALQNELTKDGLISDPQHFSLSLSSKELMVNQKKQSEAMRQKYQGLLEGVTGHKIGKGDNFSINYSTDDNDKN